MLQTILVPLDGSPVAEQGLTSACRLAKETGATLSLVRGVFYVAVEPKNQEANRVAVREARQYLDRMRDTLTRDGFTVHTEVLPCDPVDAILFAADMQEVDLISICTHGSSGLSHALLGSVAEAVLRRSDTPILRTRARDEPAEQGMAPYRRILVPLNGTVFAEAALAYLAQTRIADAADLLLLRAVEPVMPAYSPGLIGKAAVQFYSEADKETQRRLLDADEYLHAAGAALHGKAAWCARVTLGRAGPVILAAARSDNVDLIVLVTHGRHGLERLIHGSVARELLHHAETPVLLLHSAEVHASVPDEHRTTR